jgi:ABC-type phosphate transport system substrate-binding protein
MFVRKSLAGAVAAAVAGSVIALSAGPASAAVDPDDTTFTPVAADLIGVGSDTSQHAIKLFADAWNNSGQAPVKFATFAATGGGTITLPSGAITRPNGSGAGKALLYGSGNNADIDFARSSSAQSAAETSAGLQSFPFALDTLVMAVSGNVASNAPAALTPAQIVSIYKGETTNWSQVGGTAGVIAPKVPQAGSGTRSFFTAQLQAANGGVAVTLGANVVEVQEHDDTAIKNDANAVAPFSKGRAGLLGTTLRLETGFAADRALYNVVRGTDLGNPIVQGAFGEDGALCSTDVRPLIEAAGFKQLATPANGGVCGQATQNTVSNFTLNAQVVTTTALAASSAKAKTATLVATVTGSTSPSGTVDFFEGATEVASDVPLVSGQATANLAGVTAGDHTYTAEFTPTEGSAFEPSTSDDSTVTVKTSAKVSESFPASVAKHKLAKGTVTVVGNGATATGTVKIMKGSKVLKTATLKGGKATITLPKLTKGKNSLKAVYSGNGKVAGATKSFTIKQK